MANNFMGGRWIQATMLFTVLLSAADPAVAVDLIGYVPYYRMNGDYVSHKLPGQLAMLDEVRYFGISVNSSGSLTTNADDLNHIQSIKTIIDGLPATQRPRLGITIGGAGTSGGFSTVAASASLRDQFAQNLAALLDQAEATGVDLDWEHPAAGAERNTHYPALLARVKQEFGASRRVYANVAPSVMVSNSIFSGRYAVDGASLMTYDLGWWSSDPSNPHTGEHSLPEYVEDAVKAWTDSPGAANGRPWVFGSWGNDAPAEKLGVGLPFYGRGFAGSGGTAVAYQELVAGGATTDGSAYEYFGSKVWIPSLDDVQQRVEFAAEEHLQSIIFWELAQDLDPEDAQSMLRTAYQRKLSLELNPADFDGNGSVDADDLSQWASGFGLDAAGDADDDNDTDGNDFLLWQRQVAASGVGAFAATPEPSSLLLFCCALFVSASARNRSNE